MAVLSGATASGRQFFTGQLGTSAGVAYTAPANNANVTSPSATAYIKEIIFTNTSASSATVTVYIVPSGGTVGAANTILSAITVNPNDAKILSGLNTMMPAGSTIQIIASTSSVITCIISGVEVQ